MIEPWYCVKIVPVNVEKAGSGSGTVTSSPAGINCGVDCSGEFPEGTVVTLTAKAAEDSKFTGWSGGDCVSSGTGPCKMTLRFVYPTIYPCVCLPPTVHVTATFELEPESMPNLALSVNKTGSGSGTITSSPPGIDCGSECSTEYEWGKEVTLSQEAAKGSEFTGWDGACSGTGECKVTMTQARKVIAQFDEKAGPINKQTLALTKSPDPSTGQGVGTVSSKAKEINCASACNEAVGRLYKNQAIVLTAAPHGEGSAFDKWVGCPTTPEGTVCKVPADKADYKVEAVFKGTSKAFSPAEALTLSKGESEVNRGYGTVKASGLTCESECDSTVVLYQGPILAPKFKAGKMVELKEIPAFGSKFVGWSGACSGTEPTCKVTMEEAKSVTAEFAALPNKALTIEKKYEGGLGTVSSKPKGIACGSTCTSASANMPEGSAIVLTAKVASTEPATTFVKWEGGDCAGKTELTCTVTMDKAETVKAVFSGPVKPINSPKTLTLTKDPEGSGYGTIKASGMACEALCTSASSLYAGPVLAPKFKAGYKVILKATSAPGSKAVEWTGCESNPTPDECVLVIGNEASSVAAKFDELE